MNMVRSKGGTDTALFHNGSIPLWILLDVCCAKVGTTTGNNIYIEGIWMPPHHHTHTHTYMQIDFQILIL